MKLFSRRKLLISLAVAIVLMVVTVSGGVLFALKSESFARYALQMVSEQVSELEFSNVQGNFSDALSFQFWYRDENIVISTDIRTLRVVPSCLLRFAVCVERLHADVLQIEIPLSEEKSSGPTPLPEFGLPINLIVDELVVDEINVLYGDPVYHIADIDAALEWQGSHLQVERLAGKDAWCSYNLVGEIEFVEQYPLTVDATCASQEFGEVAAQFSRSVKELNAVANYHWQTELASQAIPLQLEIHARLLEAEPNYDGRLSIDESVTWSFAPNAIISDAFAVNFDGNFEQVSLNTEVEFSEPTLGENNQLAFDGVLKAGLFEIQYLDINTPLLSSHGVGNINYQLDSDVQLQWQTELQLRIDDLSRWYQDWQGDIDANLAINGQWQNTDLTVSADIESFTGTLFAHPIAGGGDISWHENALKINKFVVSARDNQIKLDGDLYLNAENTNTLNSGGPAANRSVVDNSRSSLVKGSIALPQINQVFPAAQGAIQAQFSIAGNWPAFNLTTQGDLHNVEFDALKITAAHFDAKIDDVTDPALNINLNGQSIRYSTISAAEFSARSSGKSTKQNIRLRLDGIELPENPIQQRRQGEVHNQSLELQCQLAKATDLGNAASGSTASGNTASSHTANGNQWNGECAQLDINVLVIDELMNWGMKNPVAYRIGDNGFSIDSFCLLSNTSSLCSEQTIAFEDDALAPLVIQGSALPLSWLKPWLPSSTTVQGEWQFALSLSELLAQPKISMEISSRDASLDWLRANKPTFRVDIEQLLLTVKDQDDGINTQWQLRTRRVGAWRGQLAIKNEKLSGEVTVEQLRLLPLSPLLLESDQENVDGFVNATITLGGDLKNPLVNGDLSLAQGALVLNSLPIPISDIEFQSKIVNNHANFSGTFKAQESDGQLSGELYWQPDDWRLAINLDAEELIYRADEGFVFHVVPNLRLSANTQSIDLKGRLSIPQADISIRELPPQAATPSSDTVLVGEDATETSSTKLNTELQIVLGDKVQFSGYGLETKLRGSLNLSQSTQGILRGDGTLRLEEGRYKIYGQRLLIRVGDIIFVGDIENPQLRLEAVREQTSNDVTVGLRATGPAQNPTIQLFSDPDMADQLKLRYLLTGSVQEASLEGIDPELAAAEAALGFILDSQIGGKLTRRAGSALGVDNLKISAVSGDNGTQLGVSGYLTPKLLVRYGVGVFDSISSLTLQYELRKNLYLEAVSSDTHAVDLLWILDID